jgi:molecular chaperone DnaJ
LNIYVKPSRNFERKQNDLYGKMDVDLEDLVLGKEKVLILPNNKEIKIVIEQGHSPNEDIKVAKLGFPQVNSRAVGNLIIQLTLKLPRKLSEEQKKLFLTFISSLDKRNSWW